MTGKQVFYSVTIALLFFVVDRLESKENQKMVMQLTSSSFKNNEPIPKKYTCDGANIAPAFSWSGVPAQTKSLVLKGHSTYSYRKTCNT